MGEAVRQVLTFCVLVLTLDCVAARATPRSFLSVGAGAQVYTAHVGEPVFDQRAVGQFEVGVGTQLGEDFLLEGSFGFYGTQETQFGDVERFQVFRLECNPIMLRLRYARSGMRVGYLKPELQAGIGMYSVTRWLQPIPGIEPETERDLLMAGEVGVAALFILGRNFMATVGSRFTMTQRKDLVEQVRHLDGFGFLLGFRFFLNSPRDEAGS